MWIIVNNEKIVAVEQSQFETAPNFGEWIEVSDAENPQIGLGYVNGLIVYPSTPTYDVFRAREYPPITDYLDGIVKGDQAQIDKYIADCQAVKAKYPKGS